MDLEGSDPHQLVVAADPAGAYVVDVADAVDAAGAAEDRHTSSSLKFTECLSERRRQRR